MISAIVPTNVMVGSSVPSPVPKVRPVVLPSVSVPLVAVSVTMTGLLPASTSLTEIALPPAVEKTRAVSSSVVCAPGTTFTGASFTGVISI